MSLLSQDSDGLGDHGNWGRGSGLDEAERSTFSHVIPWYFWSWLLFGRGGGGFKMNIFNIHVLRFLMVLLELRHKISIFLGGTGRYTRGNGADNGHTFAS